MWSPELLDVPLEPPPLGTITWWDAGCPQSAVSSQCHLGCSKPCFAAAPWWPLRTFAHHYPGMHYLPASPSPFLSLWGWAGLTLGLCPLSSQGDSPGSTAPPGRGHTSPSPGQLSSRSASIRRKLHTSGGWWDSLRAQTGSLCPRRLQPPAHGKACRGE